MTKISCNLTIMTHYLCLETDDRKASLCLMMSGVVLLSPAESLLIILLQISSGMPGHPSQLISHLSIAQDLSDSGRK